MQTHLIGNILAASQPLRLPGSGEKRVLSPVAIERLSQEAGVPRWEIEGLALEAEVVPLHYLRNLARYGPEGQLRLVRARVALIGRGPVAHRAAGELAAAGIGRLHIVQPLAPDPSGPPVNTAPGELQAAEEIARSARDRNASTLVSVDTVRIRGGNPTEAVRNCDVAGSILEDSADEQLLQFACRMARIPLVAAGAQENRGQATTIFPGDAGIALVYKPERPHLDPSRPGTPVAERAVLMVAAWLAEQITSLLTGQGELLRDRLLFADLEQAWIEEFPLS